MDNATRTGVGSSALFAIAGIGAPLWGWWVSGPIMAVCVLVAGWAFKPAVIDFYRRRVRPTTVLLGGSDLDIVFGSGPPFDFYRSHIHFRTHLSRAAVVSRKRMTNCELRLDKISGRLSQHVPVKIGSTFSLNPGVPEYIDFVSYDEAIRGPAIHDPATIEAKFPINPLSNGVSYLDDQPYTMTLTASAAEARHPKQIDCRVWIEDDKLRIERT